MSTDPSVPDLDAYDLAYEGPSIDQPPRYVAVRIGPQTTSDGCVRIDRAPRPSAHRTGTTDRSTS